MISAIVLAAGESKRMGNVDKLLLPLKNSTIVESALNEVTNADFDEVIVVCNPLIVDRFTKYKCKNLKIVVNADFQQGMTSSITKGLRNVSAESNGAFICLGDMPFILSPVYRLLKEKLQLNPGKIIIPNFQGKMGNPVGFANCYYDDIFNVTNSNGCKSVINKHISNTIHVEVGNDAIFKDIDTERDYELI